MCWSEIQIHPPTHTPHPPHPPWKPKISFFSLLRSSDCSHCRPAHQCPQDSSSSALVSSDLARVNPTDQSLVFRVSACWLKGFFRRTLSAIREDFRGTEEFKFFRKVRSIRQDTPVVTLASTKVSVAVVNPNLFQFAQSKTGINGFLHYVLLVQLVLVQGTEDHHTGAKPPHLTSPESWIV